MAGRNWLLLGAALGFLGVALGAFGAHGLQTAIMSWGLDTNEQRHRLQNWEVAVRYQMYHAGALLVVGLLLRQNRSRWLEAAGVAFGFGVLVFSGCLYGYVFSGLKVLGVVVPMGGVSFLAGWLALGIGIWLQADPQE